MQTLQVFFGDESACELTRRTHSDRIALPGKPLANLQVPAWAVSAGTNTRHPRSRTNVRIRALVSRVLAHDPVGLFAKIETVDQWARGEDIEC